MPLTISVRYSPINQNNTFTSGDFISGQVILDVAKETQMYSLSVKIKGKAEVCWSERHKSTIVYSDKEKYYSVERFFVLEDETYDNGHGMLRDPSGQPYSSVVAPGRHVYPFTFQLPLQHFPPTFKGSVGKIVYTLETKLSRSMRISSKAKAEFHYVPSLDVSNPELMAPQHGTKDKQMKLFTSGSVSINIKTEKMGYYLGEGLKVLAKVQNNSSRAIKPKYCLYEKHSFFARGKRKLHTRDLLKEEGEPIEPNSRKTVTKVLPIPPSLTISILNCRILKVEYRLRVCLDVPFALDPEIKFPVVILPLQSLSGASSARNSDFGIQNQPPGGNVYPNPPPMPLSAPPFNMVPGQFGALGYPGPPVCQFPAPGYPGTPGQFAPPGYPGPPGQFALPGYPGPPGQFAPPSYAEYSGQFGPSLSHQSDLSAPPPYQEYPQLPDHPEKS
ncbi:arrestin domain-containing protein 3-like [Megalobrama amblycephala]|uniref:arrestin domain-containing protein 3-like n=1 Tax=Megalobrama amblycephala TaxID=75352 RepID=UPI002014587C|nr:arrestin domain-containing protein 3-like [Megalobrama amblycephala]